MVRSNLVRSGSVILSLVLFALFGACHAWAQQNVFTPGDPIILVNGLNDGDANAGAPPAAEGVEHSIDRNTQKYLNFLDLGSGFITTPSIGVTIVTSIRFYTANDAVERDPSSYVLEGSSSGTGGPWTVISSGDLALPAGRNPAGVALDPASQFNQAITFNNTAVYAHYRVTFPTLRNSATANSMQIGEVELLGDVPRIQTLPLITLTNTVWKFRPNTNDPLYTPADAWTARGFDDSTWLTGQGVFGFESTANLYPAPFRTYIVPPNGVAAGSPIFPGQAGSPLSGGPAAAGTGGPSAYFRTHFNWTGGTVGVTFNTTNFVDDAIIVYLNGVEIYSFNMPDTRPMTWEINTLPGGANPAPFAEPSIYPTNVVATGLIAGDNVLSVELHQQGTGSSDDIFALSVLAQVPLAPILLDPSQPTNRVVFANRTTTLSVSALGAPAPSFQWFLNNSPIDPAINPTATTSSYVIANMAPGDAGNYFAIVSNVVGVVTSRTAIVEYLNDTNPPVLVTVVGSATFDQVTVVYDGLVDPTTGSDNFNYSFDNGLIVLSVTLNPDGASVTIVLDPTTPMVENTLYTVTVENVKDLADNTILPGTTAQFRSWVASGVCGGVNFALYRQVGAGTDINLLVNHPTYPNSPDEVRQLPSFDTGADITDNYGGRVRGLFIPPTSGAWNLFITADDGSRLFFNPTGPSAAGKVLISEESPGCCTAFAGRRTGPFNLVAGQGYYLEGIYKEAGGGDYIRVAARLAADTTTVLAPMPPAWAGFPAAPAGVGGPVNISQQPASQTVLENTIASFSVGASNPNELPICYQWVKNGTDIAGATLATYSELVTLADDNAEYSVRTAVIGSSSNSAAAILHVVTDTNRPVAVRASGTRSLTNITITFSERMATAAAVDTFNYTVAGFTIDSAVLDATGTNVLLSLDGSLTPGATYQVCAQGLTDLAGNVISPNPSCLDFQAFVISCGFAVQELYFNTGAGVAISDLRNAPIYPNSPSLVRYKGLIEANSADEFDNYGTRFSGFIIPPVSGNYNFFMSSDDNGELWLSSDSNPANLQLIANEPVWNNRRDWTGTTRRNAGAPENRSSTLFPAGIPLVAGQMYYYEALMKEGGGGDNLAVAWQIPGAPEPANGSTPISGAFLGSLEDSNGASISFTTQPADTTFLIVPPTGAGSLTLLDESFNTGNGGFTVTDIGAPFEGPWTYDPATGSWKSNGQNTEIQRASSTRLTSPTLTLTRSGVARLTFAHRYSFETGQWDGGQVRISVNGGAFTAVPGSAFTQNAYSGSVLGNSAAELAGQAAFVETSAGHAAGTLITSIATLGVFTAGDTIVVQFLAANDTNTRNLEPQWEIDRLLIEQGGQTQSTVTFTTATAASITGNTNPPVFCQWYRNGVAIAGGTGPNLVISPTVADNGAHYRAQCYTPGAVAVSREALLNVVQPNTPPVFACGPNQTRGQSPPGTNVPPVTVPGWATGIQPHSITRASIVYGSDFASLPPGASLAGNAAISGGVLHLTDNVNSQSGQFFTPPATGALIDSLSLDFKLRIGGGTCCGSAIPEGTSRMADGLSVNLGTDLGAGFGEEGTGTGLIVSFDLWDNGEAGAQDTSFTAPDIDVRYGGSGASTVGYQALDGEREGGRAPSGPFVTDPATGLPMKLITGDAFVPVHINLDPDGTIDVDFKGVRIINNRPTGYQPLLSPRLGFGARTGGANANQWIDDLQLQAFSPDQSAPELNQTVTFTATVSNPSLFAVPPAIAPNGTLTYTPAPGTCGTSVVTVVAMDNGGTNFGGRDTSIPCSFTIAIACGGNACPTANARSVTNAEDTSVSITLTGSDPEGTALTFAIGTLPAHGTLAGTPPNMTYTPAANYCGPDGFTFTVNDGTCLATGAVAIVVNCVNDCPTANARSVTNAEDTSLNITLTGSDPEGTALTFAIGTQPAHGTLAGTPPNMTYTPAANYCGPDGFTFTVNDGACLATGAVAIVVNCLNDCPTATAQSVTAGEDTSKAITLAGSDPEGGALTFAMNTSPAHGTLAGTPPNVTYTPAANYCGPDEFKFTVNDGECVATGTVAIVVVCTNDCPTANAKSVTTTRNTSVAIAVTGSDPEGTALTFGTGASPAHGTLSGTPPNFTYTPAQNYCGPDGFTFTVNDGACFSTGTVSIVVVCSNTCPVATPQSVVSSGAAVNIVLAATDVDGDPLTYSVVSGPTHGTLTGTPPNLSYTPTAGYVGADSFVFRASDGTNQCNSTATVSIDVRSTGNNCPVAHGIISNPCAVPNPYTLLIISADNEEGCVVLDATGSTDADGDTLTYAWYMDGASIPFARGAVVSNCFDIDGHRIRLVVDDGRCVGTDTIDFEVITACDAVEDLIHDVNNSNLQRRNKRPLLSSLKAACASFERENINAGINQLEAFQNKVRAQIEHNNPVEAARFIATAQEIIDALRCSRALDQAIDSDDDDDDDDNGNGHGDGHWWW